MADAHATATQQADDAHATATERAAQGTEVANYRTATAVSITDSEKGRQSSSNFWTLIGMILIFVVAVVLVLGVLFLFWFFWTKIAVRVIKHGDQQIVIHIKGSPRDLLDRNKRHMDVEVLYPVSAVPLLRSADPQAQVDAQPYDPMKMRDLKGKETIVNRLDDTREREIAAAWAETKRRMVDFCTAVFAHARENGSFESNTIPRWDSLNGIDEIAVNAEYWTEMTTLLEEQNIINPKRQGKATTLNPEKCKTVVDLAMLATRDKILPHSPTAAWNQIRKYRWNSTEQHSSEQSKQPEQSERHPAYVDPEWTPPKSDAVWALPGN